MCQQRYGMTTGTWITSSKTRKNVIHFTSGRRTTCLISGRRTAQQFRKRTNKSTNTILLLTKANSPFMISVFLTRGTIIKGCGARIHAKRRKIRIKCTIGKSMNTWLNNNSSRRRRRSSNSLPLPCLLHRNSLSTALMDWVVSAALCTEQTRETGKILPKSHAPVKHQFCFVSCGFCSSSRDI